MFQNLEDGKTTLLRDIVRQVSNGIEKYNFNGLNIGVVDERGEIASLYKGIAQNDIGIKADVMDNISKAIGMKMLIRTMSPQVIVADEIGTMEDVNAINYAMSSGCKGIFTAHGQNIEDLYLNHVLNNLIDRCIFEIIIFLNPKQKGEINKIYALDKKDSKYKIINVEEC